MFSTPKLWNPLFSVKRDASYRKTSTPFQTPQERVKVYIPSAKNQGRSFSLLNNTFNVLAKQSNTKKGFLHPIPFSPLSIGFAPFHFTTCSMPGGDLFANQKRYFWNKAKQIQDLQAQLNIQPTNTALFARLLRQLNTHNEPLKVKALVESGRYSLNDQQIIREYFKAIERLNCWHQINVAEFLKAVQTPIQPLPQTYPVEWGIPPAQHQQSYGTIGNIPPPHQQNSYNNNNHNQNNNNNGNSNVPPGSPHPQFQSQTPLEVRIHQTRSELAFRGLSALLSLGVLGLLVFILWNVMEDEDRNNKSNSPFSIPPAHSKVKSISVRFTDVKGCDEVKQELVEVVEYLKNPGKFTQLGAKLPKGVLLSGPPGTGKTLLARAIAGEAGVSFLYCSGSGFDEVFIGVGPKRVRTLFEDAKKQAPCIIFIDEIDSVGGKRSALSLSHSKESTLNQLLTEMDGFNSTSGVIVIGATNFPESLDPALTRPGRFDKIIHVPLPDLKGRKDIIDLYLKKTKSGPDVDAKILARGTPGFTGAELANLINLAAIKATIQNKPHIDMRVLEEAKDDVLMGIKRTTELTEEDRKLTAYHEGGHALVSLYSAGATPLHKATIIGRGNALGVTVSLPERDQVSLSRKQMLARLAVAMGGRAAEDLIFGDEEATSGASSDLKAATTLATAMVTKWGMSDKVGKVYHSMDQEQKSISEDEMKVVNAEIKDLLEERYNFAREILEKHEDQLHRIADALLKYETLTAEEIKMVAQGRVLNREL